MEQLLNELNRRHWLVLAMRQTPEVFNQAKIIGYEWSLTLVNVYTREQVTFDAIDLPELRRELTTFISRP